MDCINFNTYFVVTCRPTRSHTLPYVVFPLILIVTDFHFLLMLPSFGIVYLHTLLMQNPLHLLSFLILQTLMYTRYFAPVYIVLPILAYMIIILLTQVCIYFIHFGFCHPVAVCLYFVHIFVFMYV